MEIFIRLEDSDYPVNTYGGEDKELDIRYYGIQIGGELSLSLSKKTAIDLVRVLKEHLELNGNKI